MVLTARAEETSLNIVCVDKRLQTAPESPETDRQSVTLDFVRHPEN